jgi:hypothetical protein
MQSVKVRRDGISASEAADVLRSALGSDYDVQVADDGAVHIRKGFAKVKVVTRSEPGGTVFDLSGEGTSWLPLFNLISKSLSGNPLAKKAATVIGGAEAFRDDS